MEIGNESKEEDEECREAQERRIEEQEVGQGPRMFDRLNSCSMTHFPYTVSIGRVREKCRKLLDTTGCPRRAVVQVSSLPHVPHTQRKVVNNCKIHLCADTTKLTKRGFARCARQESRVSQQQLAEVLPNVFHHLMK